jgi:DNA-binding transcriptional regulator YiaG
MIAQFMIHRNKKQRQTQANNGCIQIYSLYISRYLQNGHSDTAEAIWSPALPLGLTLLSGVVYSTGMSKRPPARQAAWDSRQIQALRRHLGLTQQEFSRHLGTRQQTISEWETGVYQPRGASATLLSIIAERAGFRYEAARPEQHR